LLGQGDSMFRGKSFVMPPSSKEYCYCINSILGSKLLSNELMETAWRSK